MKKSVLIMFHLLFWIFTSLLVIFVFQLISIPASIFGGKSPGIKDYLTALLIILPAGACIFYASYFSLNFFIKRTTRFIWIAAGYIILTLVFLVPAIVADLKGSKSPDFLESIIIFLPVLYFNLFGYLFKTFFEWIKDRKIKAELEKDKLASQLELLKAKLNPHFLFNTLNNIYSFSLTKSPQAQVLVEKLAGTLQYMIAECDVALVHLEMELKMIMDYIELEKVRYGNRLQMKIDVMGECRNKLIAPLLLIPFVENCFKHGTSKMLEEPWIEMKITIEDNMLFFALVNSKPEKNVYDEKKGIGLNNVRKRLDILYQKRYSLEISNSVNYFSVTLNLPLGTCTTGTGHMLNESGFKRS